MKINLEGIPPEGIEVVEDIFAEQLALDSADMVLRGPLKAYAHVSRITNAVHVELELLGTLELTCTRCLNTFTTQLDKVMTLDYIAEPRQHVLDLDPDIREELILGFPIKNLCTPDCKGLCITCGMNLNEGSCKCGEGKK